MTTQASTASSGLEVVSWEQYLRDSAVPRDLIDDFLQRPHWTQFDAELGYVLHNSQVQWGLDGSRTMSTFESHGARSRLLYGNRKPRINSYGNSFTECNQVSDGETWQEYLAGHFGEPIGNYGVGGHGVYQAYRRMLRHEKTEHGAEYVILYIWGDDSIRSLMRSRWVAVYPWHTAVGVRDKGLFHGNPWANVEADLEGGEFIEKENPLSTPESLYKMCDPEWMIEHLRDDLAVQLGVYAGKPELGWPGKILDLDRRKVDRLAEIFHFRFDWSSTADAREQALKLLNVYSQRATIYILDKVRAFTKSFGKKLLIILNYTAREDAFRDLLVSYDGVRQDREILDYLIREGCDYFDMNAVHQSEYEKRTGSYSEYMKQYHVGGVGHYSPRGNHFFAYSIKSKLLEMLDPRPLPYQTAEAPAIDFSGYLPGTR